MHVDVYKNCCSYIVHEFASLTYRSNCVNITAAKTGDECVKKDSKKGVDHINANRLFNQILYTSEV